MQKYPIASLLLCSWDGSLHVNGVGAEVVGGEDARLALELANQAADDVAHRQRDVLARGEERGGLGGADDTGAGEVEAREGSEVEVAVARNLGGEHALPHAAALLLAGARKAD